MKHRLLLVVTLASIAMISFAVFAFVWQSGLISCESVDRETLFQISAFNTFSSGKYEGYMSYGELAKHGDFGIGTFDDFDGEMIALNGVFYQIPLDGEPKQADVDLKTPYATVTFFEADQTFKISGGLNYSELTAYIDKVLPTENAIYAIKVGGIYDYAKTRSVPVQTKPYPPLAEAIKNQSVFTLNNVSATAVGFWFPQSMDGVDFVGYHLHLITEDYSAGGHLLECTIANATVEIDQTNKFSLVLP